MAGMAGEIERVRSGNVPRQPVAGEAPARQAAPFHVHRLYLTLVVVLAAMAQALPLGSPGTELLVVVAGTASLIALMAASRQVRSHPSPSWTASQRDPFLLLAAAAAMLMGRAVVNLTTSRPALLDHIPWTTAVAAAVLAIGGFSIMLRDLTPGRAVDALFKSAIVATALGTLAWVAAQRAFPPQATELLPTVSLLGPALLDLVVVSLGLQVLHLRTRTRDAAWLMLMAWVVVLAGDVTRLLSELASDPVSPGPLTATRIAAFGLLGAAALHPHSTQVVETVLAKFDRLSSAQIWLMASAVLLGPAILGLGLHEQRSATTVIVLSAALPLLVVTYLVRLVQGRAKLEHRAHHDELTGLANRTLFADRAAVAIAHARRSGGQGAVLFLDLDRFKNVNDSLGHAVGNLLLQAVAKRLRAATRVDDTVARLGGDEFVVLLAELEDETQAATVAATILDVFSEPFTVSGHRVFASPSIGIATFPADGHDAETLLKNADTAMYRAKDRGRRTYCTYKASMNEQAQERLALEARLHSAIERDELRLHYQPKIHLPTGRVTGMEALLRWQHPELGLLQPASFISLAEESGLIVPLGEWALNEACRQNQKWAEAGFGPLVVAVNLSLRQFQQQRIDDVTARVLRATGLDPELLELEVTESLAMHEPDDVTTTLQDLRAMGVRCSIDDFGTGYSGLSQLTRLPIDKVKIDKSFVATIDRNREAPIVMAVVALAHGLGLEVVAEGVETDIQLERLQELGCDEMQGFLFSEPVSAEHFEQLLMLEDVSPGAGRLVGLPNGLPKGRHLVAVAGA
jgi:diguanylate cyclase (GGDEF)-like protein